MTFKFNPLTGELDLFQRRSNDPATSIWTRFTVTASASSSSIIDQVALSGFSSLKYIVSIEDNGRVKTQELLVCNDNGDIKDAVFGRLGASINFAITSIANAGNFELQFTNNETNNLNINIARLVL
jgi:hypothetical protein